MGINRIVNTAIVLILVFSLSACKTENRQGKRGVTRDSGETVVEGIAIAPRPLSPCYARGGDLQIRSVTVKDNTATIILESPSGSRGKDTPGNCDSVPFTPGGGQYVELIVDDDPNKSIITTGDSVVIKDLSEGDHYLRAFLSQSDGESYKGPGLACKVATKQFYVGKPVPFDDRFSKPMITYNLPRSLNHAYQKYVLLDFLVTNVALGPEQYKVAVIIDGVELETRLYSLLPYVISGLPMRATPYTIQLKLIDPSGKPVVAPFATTSIRYFYVRE